MPDGLSPADVQENTAGFSFTSTGLGADIVMESITLKIPRQGFGVLSPGFVSNVLDTETAEPWEPVTNALLKGH
jgi:hypothetical protein